MTMNRAVPIYLKKFLTIFHVAKLGVHPQYFYLLNGRNKEAAREKPILNGKALYHDL